MIKKINIKNFKNLENLELDHISPVTLIGGNNNIGKSNILEAIFFLHDRMNPNVISRLFSFRGLSLIIKPEIYFSPIFNNFDMKKNIEIMVENTDRKKESIKITFKPDYVPRKIETKNIVTENFKNEQDISSLQAIELKYFENEKERGHSCLSINNGMLSLDIENLKSNSRLVTYLNPRNRSNSNDDSNKFGQIDLIGKQDILVDVLKILDPRIKSLSSIMIGNQSIIHGDIGIGRKIPLNLMGDAVSRILTIVLAIATNENGILLIDEFENGLHYSILDKIWSIIVKTANEFKCQLIITTHSYECIQSAEKGIKKEFANDFCYIRLFKNRENITDKRTFNINELDVSLSNEWEVR